MTDDDQILIATDSQGIVVHWHLSDENIEKEMLKMKVNQEEIKTAYYSPCGKYLAMTTPQGIKLWDIELDDL